MASFRIVLQDISCLMFMENPLNMRCSSGNGVWK